MIINIIYSILLIIGWVAILKYRKIIKSWTGNFYWAEKYIGNWWTYLVLIAIGMAMIFYWIRYPFIH
jgi:hypothetical protein